MAVYHDVDTGKMGEGRQTEGDRGRRRETEGDTCRRTQNDLDIHALIATERHIHAQIQPCIPEWKAQNPHTPDANTHRHTLELLLLLRRRPLH